MVILNDLRRLRHRLQHGAWPAREEVEPARDRRQYDEQLVDAGIATLAN